MYDIAWAEHLSLGFGGSAVFTIFLRVPSLLTDGAASYMLFTRLKLK
jgi:hypothetical protein